MMELKIDEEFQKLIPPLLPEEYKKLEESIIDDGCRDPLVIWDNIILDGHNRYEICMRNGITFSTVEKSFSDRLFAKIWIIKNQLGRRNLSKYDRGRLAMYFEKSIAEIAKEKEHNRKTGGTCQKSDKSIDTKKELAKIAQVSHDTIHKIKYIEENADEKQKKELSEQAKSINYVYNELQKKEKREKIKQQFKEPQIPETNKKYNIILADPPWCFKHYSDKGKGKSPDNHYKCESIEDIKEIPARIGLDKNIADDCVLFMWVTYPFLQKSFDVLKAWGFEYKTVAFTWVKLNKKGKGWFWGMGYWTRSNAEICLLATRGTITRQSSSVHQIIDTPVEEHSKKPDVVRDRIVELCGDLPRIELFARKKTDGWDSWGNEV